MIFIFIIIALILQITVLDTIAIGWIRPDLLLVLTVAIAMHRGKLTGLKAGLFAGAIADIFSVGRLGLNIFLLGACGFLVGYFADKIYKESMFAQCLVCAIASLCYGIFYWCGMHFYPAVPSFASVFWYAVLPTAIYTTAICPFVFRLFKMP